MKTKIAVPRELAATARQLLELIDARIEFIALSGEDEVFFVDVPRVLADVPQSVLHIHHLSPTRVTVALVPAGTSLDESLARAATTAI